MFDAVKKNQEQVVSVSQQSHQTDFTGSGVNIERKESQIPANPSFGDPQVRPNPVYFGNPFFAGGGSNPSMSDYPQGYDVDNSAYMALKPLEETSDNISVCGW